MPHYDDPLKNFNTLTPFSEMKLTDTGGRFMDYSFDRDVKNRYKKKVEYNKNKPNYRGKPLKGY